MHISALHLTPLALECIRHAMNQSCPHFALASTLSGCSHASQRDLVQDGEELQTWKGSCSRCSGNMHGVYHVGLLPPGLTSGA